MTDKSQKPLPYGKSALGWDLIRLHEIWRKTRRDHDRRSIFRYLSAVYDLVSVWEKENRAVDRARRALRLKSRPFGKTIEPFAAVIVCTSSRKDVDGKARSKWAHTLKFAAKYKSPDEALEDFVRRHGGINRCVAKLSRLSRSHRTTEGNS